MAPRAHIPPDPFDVTRFVDQEGAPLDIHSEYLVLLPYPIGSRNRVILVSQKWEVETEQLAERPVRLD